ncbi:MAG: MFS transporter [Nocardioidaceae bacterium]|nr:MFS transporter [Nocardioidaceae bacterium]
MLKVLRQRSFALLWIGGLISVTGDWVLYSALPYFVYQETGSVIASAGMIVAELAPEVLLGSVAGVFVDRWDRKRVLVATNVLQALAVAVLFLVSYAGVIWVVFVVAVAQSVLASFSGPAESALLPMLVDEAQLVAANSLNALNNRLGRLAGLPLGIAVLSAVGLGGVVLVDCASFVAASLLIAVVVVPARRHPDGAADESAAKEAMSAMATLGHEWLAGIRIVRHDKTIAVIFVVLGIMTYGGTMLDPPQAAWVRDVLHQGPGLFAWLMTVHAIGGVVGTVLVGTLGSLLTPRALIGWPSLIAGVLLMVKFGVASVPLALVLSAISGATSVASLVGVNTMIQRGVPNEYQGRVFGALGASGGLLSLLGAATGGGLAELLGITAALEVASILTAFAGVVVLCTFADSQRHPRLSASPVSRTPGL